MNARKRYLVSNKRFRKLKAYEQEFVDMNQDLIEIVYYPKKAKYHKTGPSNFNITKGYALLFSKKLLKHFKNCEIVSITVDSVKYTGLSIKEVLLWEE